MNARRSVAPPDRLARTAGLLAVLLATVAAPALAQERIITLGGEVTEIVYALGADDRIVGTDTTSVYPPAALETPKVGYVRRLSAEGVLSLEPDLILASGAIGPDTAVDQLEAAGVRFVRLPRDYTIGGIHDKVDAIAAVLGREQAGDALNRRIATRWAEARARIAQLEGAPGVLFFFAAEGAPQAAGVETAADAVIRLAGGRNVFTEHRGVKSFSMEAAVQRNPDVILVMDHQAEELGGMNAVRTHPALALTRAADAGAVIAVDAPRLLQFGPRTPAALADLAQRIRAAGAQAAAGPADALAP